MGRIAGVTSAQTRDRLLHAAAQMFAERGYDGSRVADIAAAAGVSNGALYAHFASKAELLVEALRVHGRRRLAELFEADPDRSMTDLLLDIGRTLPRRCAHDGSLIVEGLVAARRDDEVAGSMREYIRERMDWLGALIRAAQTAGDLDPGLSPVALAQFCLLLSMGGALVGPSLEPADDRAWSDVLSRIAAGLAPRTAPPDTRSTA